MNNEFYLYLKLRPYTRQWLIDTYGDPVRFDPSSIMTSEIKDKIMRMPLGKEPLTRHSDDEVAVAIPSSRKNPQYYNWMPPSSISMLESMVENRFDRSFKKSVWESVENGAEIKATVEAFCHQHGIDIEYADTLKQRINRMRMDYIKRGIIKKKAR